MDKIIKLTQAPSREQLFDSLRLRQRISDWRLDFFGEHTPPRNGYLPGDTVQLYFLVKIHGLACADESDGQEWYFWGERQVFAGEKLPLTWDPSEGSGFVFGKWNFETREGRMQFGDKPFFGLTLPQYIGDD